MNFGAESILATAPPETTALLPSKTVSMIEASALIQLTMAPPVSAEAFPVNRLRVTSVVDSSLTMAPPPSAVVELFSKVARRYVGFERKLYAAPPRTAVLPLKRQSSKIADDESR